MELSATPRPASQQHGHAAVPAEGEGGPARAPPGTLTPRQVPLGSHLQGDPGSWSLPTKLLTCVSMSQTLTPGHSPRVERPRSKKGKLAKVTQLAEVQTPAHALWAPRPGDQQMTCRKCRNGLHSHASVQQGRPEMLMGLKTPVAPGLPATITSRRSVFCTGNAGTHTSAAPAWSSPAHAPVHSTWYLIMRINTDLTWS